MKNGTYAIRTRRACAVILLALFAWSGISPSPAWAHPPVVSITSPTSGATVSGTITVSADASSEIGVAGVQFFSGWRGDRRRRHHQQGIFPPRENRKEFRARRNEWQIGTHRA